MRNDPVLRQAELTILNAPFEAGGWERAVASIADATRSSAAQLLGLGGPLLLPLNVQVGNFAGRERYFADPELHGADNWRVGSTTNAMAIQHEAHYDAYRRAHPTGDYDDAVSDLDIPFGCQSALLLDANHLLGVALLRSRRDGPCDAETLTTFAALRRQMARAVRVQLTLDGEAAELMLGHMATLHGATFLLDRHGALSALTPAAEALMGDGGPMLLDGLVPRFRDALDDHRFGRAVGEALRGTGDAVHQVMLGQRAGHPGACWRATLLRLPAREHGLGFEPHLALTVRSLTDAGRRNQPHAHASEPQSLGASR